MDSVALRAASLALQASHADQEWEGFSGPAEFILCTKDGGTLYALSKPPQQPGLLPLTSAGHKGLYYSAARPTRLQEQCFRLNYVFEGRQVLSFPQIDSIYSVRDPVEALVIALIHEEFHRFQQEAFGPTIGSGDRELSALERADPLPDTLIASSRFRRFAEEEREILADAIEESDTAQVMPLLRKYLMVRTDRQNLVPDDLRASEAHEERKEATANLVAYRLVTRLMAKPPTHVSDLVRSDLLSTPAFDQDPGKFRHWHIYATGSAIGIILDKLGVSWRREVQDGQTLFDRLQEVAASADSGPIGA